ncbi:MAG: Ig-like domain-containing protein, partial [Pirellulaceae bacterium]|nr:Ig-like domain-containing protein [Pirellulaceae bacterium]
KVELWVNGTLLTTDTTAPYSFAWDTTKVANGTATLTAKAVDAAGNAASSAVAVNVANAVVADTTPPAVALANPASGSRVSGSVKVSASASDNSGVSGLSLALFINGSRVATATGSSSLSYTWNTRKIAAGTYTLRVDARDAAGNVASQSVTVTR